MSGRARPLGLFVRPMPEGPTPGRDWPLTDQVWTDGSLVFRDQGEIFSFPGAFLWMTL